MDVSEPLALPPSIPRPSSSARRSFARPPPARRTFARHSVDGDVDSVADQMARILDMNSHMYHHMFGYYYDPAAPYPRPPDWPPQ